jgi:uncharacterized protein (DUF342 family)
MACEGESQKDFPAPFFKKLMRDQAEPNYQISGSNRIFNEGPEPAKPLSEVLEYYEEIKKTGVQMREAQRNLNELAAKQRELEEKYISENEGNEEARIANALVEIQENVACLNGMKKQLEQYLNWVVKECKIFEEDLAQFESKVEN